MKSPFPGMDPYLERYWGDVHQGVITYIRDWLQSRLPSDLRARMQERVYIELPDTRRAMYYPDVRVVERLGFSQATSIAAAVAEPLAAEDSGNGHLITENPLIVHLDIEPMTESYVEIIDVKSGHRVITAIEVLSPTNKRPGEGQRLYLQKRADQHSAGVNTVEIDLLRGGQRILMLDAEQIPPSHRTAYQVCVWRAHQPGQVAIYRLPLATRLPEVAIPLRPTDQDVVLDLQAIVEQCYRNGGYDDIDYQDEPDPPLSPVDKLWADALLREQGKR
jgi:hypothetical protein